MGHDLCLSKICVAADCSDSIPDSSSYMNKHGYHPLEELKVSNDVPPAKLSSAEIARTTVEVCVCFCVSETSKFAIYWITNLASII